MNVSKRSRALYDELGRGWNTWDIQSVTAHVLLPERLRLNIGFFVTHTNRYAGDLLWDYVESFGEHSVDGGYNEIIIRFEGGLYKIETTAEYDKLAIKITPVKTRLNAYAALEVSQLFCRNIDISYRQNSVVAAAGNRMFTIKTLNTPAQPDWDPITAHHIPVKLDDTVYFTVNQDICAGDIDKILAEKRESWLQSHVSSEGKLGRGLTAMRRSLLWNMVYDFKNSRVITPVSRNWCKRPSHLGDYVLFGWDTFFAGLQYGLLDKRLAYATVFSILEEQTPEGMIPNFGCGAGLSRDRSEPQVGALCVWKLYLQFKDKWFVEECYPRLLCWNRWRFQERDFNGDGLLELASVPWEYEETDDSWIKNDCGGKQGAMWESGFDNSTMWDDAVFNAEHHCMELSYVGLNALMAADCEILAKMAALLGKPGDERELLERGNALSERINAELWSDGAGTYLNRDWGGKFNPVLSLTHFYTITSGTAKGERLERLIREHLLNPEEFWGEYVIPNISGSDPSFTDQEYWRGRIWAPTNFLVGEGLMRIRDFSTWDRLIEKGLDLFIGCWDKLGIVGENYNAITGEAAERGKASDRFYHWGALLVYMAVERLVNFNEWEDRTEYLPKPDWLDEIRNLPVQE